MIGSKLHKQYHMWIAAAIQKARKDPIGKVSHVDISPRLDPSTAFSFMQWAVAEGWLHTDGHRVYEQRKTSGLSMSEILHDLNKEPEPDPYIVDKFGKDLAHGNS